MPMMLIFFGTGLPIIKENTEVLVVTSKGIV